MMTRILSLLCLLLSSACLFGATPPNVVMIISDDHAWTDYGFMGHPTIQTPNLDRLARESLTFRRGYVPSSLCCPSLASIITGRYPHQHKVTSNDPPVPRGGTNATFQKSAAFLEGREIMNRYMEEVPTLPRLLASQGYLCLQTGKWWQGHFSHGGFTHGMTKGGRHGDEGLDIGRKTMQPIQDIMSLSKSESKPFFVWYAPLLPHTPHTPPQRLLDKYMSQTSSEHIAKYWAMIEWFDETIGELLGQLDQQGVANNTIVVYVSDNGWLQKSDGQNYAPKSKQSQYDGGLRSPIMIRWPGHVEPRMSDELAQSIDFMPTLLKALGMPPATPAVPGIDLLDASQVAARKEIYGECFTHNSVDLSDPAKSLRWRWTIDGYSKLIVPDPTNEPTAVVELYDLAKDPHETTNLADTMPAQVSQLRTKLDQWWRPQ
ncbi:MAG: sulfatase [Pirellulaceae bacterium]|nr:sulfatase [Pirellulaceae bacterium]